MTEAFDPLFDTRIADWLNADPDVAPRQVLDLIEGAVPALRQRRSVRLPRRFPTMGLPARLIALAVLGTLLIASASLLSGAGGAPSPEARPTSSTPGAASPPTSSLVTFSSPRYGYSVAIDAGWQVRPATDRWLGNEPPHQSDPAFADRFVGSGASAGRTVLIKARQLAEGTTAAAWTDQWERTREVVGQCFGSGTPWMDWTIAGIHARRLAWRCDSPTYDKANYDEVTVVANGNAFVITGSPSMVAALVESIQLPD